MNNANILEGRILTPKGFINGKITFSKKIISIIPSKRKPQSPGPLIIPGMIDLHVHGGGGRDIMEGGLALETMARLHASHGTTGFLATTVTAPYQELVQVFQSIRDNKPSNCLGIHLEGPYINNEKLGAQPDFVQAFNLEQIKKLHQICPIKVITLAPEKLPDLKIIGQLKKMKMVVQLGHSLASYEQSEQAFKHGAQSCTHLFNAMSSFHHRAPGLPGAALALSQYSELIPDLLHVHPGAIKLALRSIPKLYFVTDATSATGMPDGEFKLGSHTVSKCQNGVRLPDGTLAGSALTMDQALRNVISLGIKFEQAIQHFSQFPAELLGLKNKGVLKQGADADILILNSKYHIKEVFIQGKRW